MELLEKLESDEVVRRRIDLVGEGNVWLLDHDYLARGVLELDRRAQRWPWLLGEAARSYEGARGVWERWKKLLPVLLQVRLFYEWLRGRLSYDDAVNYAWLSTVRFIIWVLILLAIGLGWRQIGMQKKAERLFAEFGEGQTEAGAVRALWNLAGSDKSLRRAFLDTALAHEPNARRFKVRAESILHAAIGFREEERQYVLAKMVSDRCMPKDPGQDKMDPAMIDACALLLYHVAAPQGDVKNFIAAWVQRASSLEELLRIQRLFLGVSDSGRSDAALVELVSLRAFEMVSNSHLPMFVDQEVRRNIKNLFLASDRRRIADIFLKDLRAGGHGGRISSVPVGDVLTTAEKEEFLDWIKKSIGMANGVRLADRVRLYEAITIYNVVGANLSRRDARKILVLLLERAPDNVVFDFLASSEDMIDLLRSEEALKILESYIGSSDIGISMLFHLKGPLLVRRLDSSDALSLWRFCWDKLSEPGDSTEAYSMLESIYAILSPADAREAALLAVSMTRRLSHINPEMSEALEFIERSLPAEELHGSGMLERKYENWMAHSLAMRLGDPYRVPSTLVRKIVALVIDRLKEARDPEAMLRVVELLKPRLTAAEGEQILRALLAREGEIGRVVPFFVVLGDLASSELAGAVLQKWIKENRTSLDPQCDHVLPLIRNSRDPNVVDILKWPTCGIESRNLLISGLDELVQDASFESEYQDGKYHADIWGKFLPWARKQGLDIESPPILPDLNRLQAERY